MNIGYANGGSEVITPLGVPLAGPVYGESMIYAELEAWMIKATKAIVDTLGHYARPDVLKLLVQGGSGWQPAGSTRDLSRSGSLSRTMRSRARPTRVTSTRRR